MVRGLSKTVKKGLPPVALAGLALALSGCGHPPVVTRVSSPPVPSGSAPTSPPAVVCGVASRLNGPTAAPLGAVTLEPGQAIADEVADDHGPGTTFWFAPGAYTLGSGVYNQIDPQEGDTFIGAPGAILNGQGLNDFSFVSDATHVTIEHLTIENFVAPQNQGVVNQDQSSYWTIENDTIEHNPHGAGVMVGSEDVVTGDCLTENGQYGFQSFSTTGSPTDITITGNEISYNDTANYTAETKGCGCAGGAKFWDTTGATVTGNYVHNNASVGFWADTDNSGFNISGNYFSTNYGEALTYEISYNARIVDNTFVHNAIGSGPKNRDFPTGAVYIADSGSDSRVPGPYGTRFDISGNVFTDNWGGVVLWEDSNRYCGSSANTSTSACTLVDPRVYTVGSCARSVPTSKSTGAPDYYDGCRWKTQHVEVYDNRFTFTPKRVASDCDPATECGFNGLFSEYGTYPPFTGWVVPNHISNDQDDHFSDNTYAGPWEFVGFNQGEVVNWTEWTSGFTDEDGSGDRFAAQDAGSTYTK